MLVFTRIPGGCDIGLVTLEDNHRIDIAGKGAPNRVGLGYVADECAKLAALLM